MITSPDNLLRQESLKLTCQIMSKPRQNRITALLRSGCEALKCSLENLYEIVITRPTMSSIRFRIFSVLIAEALAFSECARSTAVRYRPESAVLRETQSRRSSFRSNDDGGIPG
ncbi:hypothetical protein Y032_0027g1568 [Ancylostoma ceylanicum]|uniref:Uncharacterized protein n=1 Tax=Ancylostoma ceylanicum TaxID=53326 RepID=A0A016UVQ8_9BILA|nr:hypothetical protein Y032_0027g1568 [Ancylostoma ceylanicum]